MVIARQCERAFARGHLQRVFIALINRGEHSPCLRRLLGVQAVEHAHVATGTPHIEPRCLQRRHPPTRRRLQHRDALCRLRRGKGSGDRAQRFATAHHALDLSFLLQLPAFQRLLLQGALGGQHYFLSALGPLTVDASEEQDQRIRRSVDRVVQPVVGRGQVVQWKCSGASTGAEYASDQKLAALSRRSQKNVRAILLEAGTPIGLLRLISMRGDIGLKFEDLTYIDFLDRDKLTIDVRKLIQTTKNKSGKHSLSETDLLDDIKRLEMAGHDPWHMCCGHDLLNVLAVGLRKALGSHNP